VVSFAEVNSASHLYVIKALGKIGLNETNTRFSVVDPSNVLAALEEGRIDAGYTWGAEIQKAVSKGYKVLSTAGEVPGSITDVLAFHPQVIEKRPQDVQAVVNAMVEARDFAVSHSEEAAAIMAESMGLSVHEINTGISGVIHPNRQENIRSLTHSEAETSLFLSGKNYIKFLFERGQISKIPDLDQLIEGRFIQAVQKKEFQ
jgi:NitT/TauT family transport system substrate-binding protein